MAEIYKATDTVLDREVAVKVLAAPPQDDDVRARFSREALAAARLSGGPNTVATYDVGDLDGRPFLVMEYLPGGSLAERIAGGGGSKEQALTWLEQAARALDFAHAHGVVHRDVKPGNLLLDSGGNVHVADFGIARAEGLESHTQTGVVLGTAGYLAPEQARGGAATAASDRYALAVVAHELLTGARPEAARPAGEGSLAHVFTRALAVDPDARFSSCLELVAALREALGAGAAPTVAMRPTRSRRRLAFAAVAVSFGALAAVLAVGLTAGGTAHRSKPGPPAVVVRRVTVPAPASAQPDAGIVARRAVGNDRNRGEGARGKGHGHGHGKKKGKD